MIASTLTTPNIERRRAFRFWQSWVGMLAGTLPLWIVPLLIAMAFPVMKPGNLIGFKNGLLLFGDCTCCDGGGGTPGVNCTRCTGGTPLTWSITFTSVVNGRPCSNVGAVDGYLSGGNGTLGTYTLTQQSNPCLWEKADFGPTVFWRGSDNTCADAIESDGNVDVVLTADLGGTMSVRAQTAVQSPPIFPSTTFGGSWFVGTVADSHCCVSQTFSNDQTTYDPGVFGINGSAVATPHC